MIIQKYADILLNIMEISEKENHSYARKEYNEKVIYKK